MPHALTVAEVEETMSNVWTGLHEGFETGRINEKLVEIEPLVVRD